MVNHEKEDTQRAAQTGHPLAAPFARLVDGLETLPPAPVGGENILKDAPGEGVSGAQAVYNNTLRFGHLKPTSGQHG